MHVDRESRDTVAAIAHGKQSLRKAVFELHNVADRGIESPSGRRDGMPDNQANNNGYNRLSATDTGGGWYDMEGFLSPAPRHATVGSQSINNCTTGRTQLW